jgi:signal transduction histidine kinase
MERETPPERQIDLLIPADLPTVPGDALRLEQVVHNLLANARKYSPEDSLITVRVEAAPDAVCFSVQDEGMGIPPDEQERIFDRFHRAANIDPNVAGLGLGLHIAGEIVRAHGGRLSVESRPGAGSTFRVILVREQTPAVRAAASNPVATARRSNHG